MSNTEFVPQVIAVLVLLAGAYLTIRGAFSIVIGLIYTAAAPLLTPKEALSFGCILLLSLALFNVVPGLLLIRLAGGYFGWFG